MAHRVIYITGNHDEMLRRYADLELGNFQLTDKLVIELNGKTSWIFHGDVFDASTKRRQAAGQIRRPWLRPADSAESVH